MCVAGSRVFIERPLYKKFVAALVQTIKHAYGFNPLVGDPNTKGLGPLLSHTHREKVERYVALAKEEGGEILIGGHRSTHLKPPFDKGAFYMPTVVAGLDYTSLRPPSFPFPCHRGTPRGDLRVRSIFHSLGKESPKKAIVELIRSYNIYV